MSLSIRMIANDVIIESEVVATINENATYSFKEAFRKLINDNGNHISGCMEIQNGQR